MSVVSTENSLSLRRLIAMFKFSRVTTLITIRPLGFSRERAISMIRFASIRALSRLHLCVRLFTRERRGISAVEFSTVLPFMLVAYIGSVEVGNAIAIKLRVTSTARTVANLASQYFTIMNADMSNIMSASTAVTGSRT